MPDPHQRTDAAPPSTQSARQRRRGHRLPSLALQLQQEVVPYPERPDRVTVSPADATGLDRMASWLTVDRSAVVDLATVR